MPYLLSLIHILPEYTAEADAVGTLRMLEAVRILGLEKKTKIYQASTSDVYKRQSLVSSRFNIYSCSISYITLCERKNQQICSLWNTIRSELFRKMCIRDSYSTA